MQVFEPVQKELELVNERLNREYTIRAGHLSSYARIELDPVDLFLRPGTVILAGKALKSGPERLVSLAAVVQFIYLASRIHFAVSNEDDKHSPGKDPRDGSQFPVLVGDYLYGKFFTSLCSAGLIKYLEPLSRVICSVHEAGVLREKTGTGISTPSLQKQVIYQETATLLETGCRLAADLAGASNDIQEKVAAAGKEFGIAVGLRENNIDNRINNHLDKAEEYFTCLPGGLYREHLIHLLHSFKQAPLQACREM